MGVLDAARVQQLEDRMVVAMERQLMRIVQEEEKKVVEQKVLEDRVLRLQEKQVKQREDQVIIKQQHETKALEGVRRREKAVSHQVRKQERMYQDEIKKIEAADEKHRLLEDKKREVAVKHAAMGEAKHQATLRAKTELERRADQRRSGIMEKMQVHADRRKAVEDQKVAKLQAQHQDEEQKQLAVEQRRRAFRQMQDEKKRAMERGVSEKMSRSEKIRQDKDVAMQRLVKINDEAHEKRAYVHSIVAKMQRTGNVGMLRNAVEALSKSHADRLDSAVCRLSETPSVNSSFGRSNSAPNFSPARFGSPSSPEPLSWTRSFEPRSRVRSGDDARQQFYAKLSPKEQDALEDQY